MGTAVLAARATLKVEDVLEEHEKTKFQIDDLAAKVQGSAYSEDDARADTVKLYLRTAAKLGKLYGPAFICGAVSIAALSGSHAILNRRYLAITAGYAALDKGFEQYRARVVEQFGEDKDREFRQTLEMTDVVEVTADGKKTKRKVAIGVKGLSEYSIVFDESNPNWQRTDGYNQIFLRCQQNYAKDLLHSRGHVTLNDVYDMIGAPRTKAGQIVGWVKGNGDDFIDFGVFRMDEFRGLEFVKGNERSIILDFNVDGNILDLI